MSDIKEFDGLYARLEDLKRRADRGDVGISAFLSPRELHFAKIYLTASRTRFFSFGGYGTAERRRIYVLPEYMEEVDSAEQLADFGHSSEIEVIEARGSGFESLSHRSFMGSLLGLGIERSVIGDIIVTDTEKALVVCDAAMADFLLSNWDKVGRDRIRSSRVTLAADFAPQRSYLPISDTVASPRLDCVVAAFCSLSRDKAREAVETGTVELDYECCERSDREVKEGSLISVRGFGKFRVLSLSDRTRKGRFRLTGEKFL